MQTIFSFPRLQPKEHCSPSWQWLIQLSHLLLPVLRPNVCLEHHGKIKVPSIPQFKFPFFLEVPRLCPHSAITRSSWLFILRESNSRALEHAQMRLTAQVNSLSLSQIAFHKQTLTDSKLWSVLTLSASKTVAFPWLLVWTLCLTALQLKRIFHCLFTPKGGEHTKGALTEGP